jgi:hypothetical protein
VANLDGNPNHSLIKVPPNQEGANPFGVAVDRQHVFWANGLQGSVGEANLDGTNVQNAMFTAVGGSILGVAVSVPVLTLGPAPAPFATTPQSTLSAPQTLTLTNTGQVPLLLGGLSFSGANASDFILDWSGCLGSVAPGQSCQLGVSFAPQSQGTRSATLQIFSNDYANSPMQVPLSGTGGALPQGPVGPAGSQGKTGARGSPGQIELVTCKTVTVKQGHRRVRRQKCTGRLVSGRVSFATAGTQASLVRGRIVYARGARVATGAGRSELVLGRLRALHPGKYTLILRRRHGRQWTTTRQSVTMD